MAFLLPQCAPPEPLHHQLSATIRQRRLSTTSRRAGAHGATESASTDHFKVPSSEPCCNLISPLVMAPRKPVRRSSRLRVRKGRDEIKTDPAPGSDMDAAEWISRVLANNGVVEVDPVTMAEQMQHLNHHAKQPVTEYYSTNSHYYDESPNLTSSSEPSQDYYSPASGNGFPRVPLGVALAAGSAVALAAVAILVQSLNNNRQRDEGTISSPGFTSGGNNNSLKSGFTGEPVTANQGSPHRTRDNKVPAEVLAGTVSAGAAIFQPGSARTGLSSTAMPSPPSLSKSTGKSSGETPGEWQSSKYASVTPFFSSDRSQAVSSYSGASPPAVSRWREDNYKSVPPFFPSDRFAVVTETVPPFLQPGSEKKSEIHGSSSKAVAPFFPDDVSRGKGPSSVESVAPFFADDSRGKGPSSVESVAPFFADDSRGNRPSYMETVTPFFADEQQSGKNGPSYMETVTPFFADEQQSGKSGPSYMETVTPFFADEQQSGKSGPSYMETVTPFFADERGSQRRENGSDSYMETVTPFFPDEQQGIRSATGVSQSKPGTIDLENVEENVKPFFPVRTSTSGQSSGGSRPSAFWDGESSSGAQRDSSAMSPTTVDLTGTSSQDVLMHSDGKQMLAEMAGKAQPGQQHREFASNMSGPFSFQGDEKLAPSMHARDLSPEELTLLAEIQVEEERRYAKMQALQAAFPALAIGAGAVGALVGVDGAFEMVGLTATASFISYELLWANKRKELLDEMSRITDHHKLFSFLQKRKIVKDDC